MNKRGALEKVKEVVQKSDPKEPIEFNYHPEFAVVTSNNWRGIELEYVPFIQDLFRPLVSHTITFRLLSQQSFSELIVIGLPTNFDL